MDRINGRVLALSIIAGTVGGGTVQIVIPSALQESARPDPFKGADAKIMEARILAEMGKRFELLELQMRASLPPEPTRQRILALEEQMKKILPHWVPPTARFVRNGH